jgi:pyruvate kinase
MIDLAPPPPRAGLSDPHELLAGLRDLRRAVYTEGRRLYASWRSHIRRRAFLGSALNLACYLALRRRDLRPFQEALIPWGLSSLGRSESHVLANLDAVIALLGAVVERDLKLVDSRPPLRAFQRGPRCLERNAEEALGRRPAPRSVRILVTLPDEVADDPGLLREILRRGTDAVRINCAHGTPAEWERMIGHLHDAERKAGRPCRLLMDLAGPKARTGEILAPADRRLRKGDLLLLTSDAPRPHPEAVFQASCTLPQVLSQVEPRAAVWIDDGKIGCAVERRLPEGLLLRVTQARASGHKLQGGKGLNFPGTHIRLSPLTDKDREDLDFVAEHADLIGYSFVQDPEDVELLQDELAARLADPRAKPLVAKIETERAVHKLPELIVAAAGRQPFAVMIARGDLAVEIGYQRLTEIQEEILWICEAAHVPVIWATQVLERLVKKGTPSRAEMTDAAMGERAECVMLNKGPFLAEAVTILDDVLTRMAAHQTKKSPRLRPLRSW